MMRSDRCSVAHELSVKQASRAAANGKVMLLRCMAEL